MNSFRQQMTFLICLQHRLRSLFIRQQMALYCQDECNVRALQNVIYPTRSCYCIFPVNSLVILLIVEGKRQVWALLKMSPAIDILSALDYVANDDDTWLVCQWWSSRPLRPVSLVYECIDCVLCSVTLMTKWVSDGSRWPDWRFGEFCGATAPSSGGKREAYRARVVGG